MLNKFGIVASDKTKTGFHPNLFESDQPVILKHIFRICDNKNTKNISRKFVPQAATIYR